MPLNAFLMFLENAIRNNCYFLIRLGKQLQPQCSLCLMFPRGLELFLLELCDVSFGLCVLIFSTYIFNVFGFQGLKIVFKFSTVIVNLLIFLLSSVVLDGIFITYLGSSVPVLYHCVLALFISTQIPLALQCIIFKINATLPILFAYLLSGFTFVWISILSFNLFNPIICHLYATFLGLL